MLHDAKKLVVAMRGGERASINSAPDSNSPPCMLASAKKDKIDIQQGASLPIALTNATRVTNNVHLSTTGQAELSELSDDDDGGDDIGDVNQMGSRRSRIYWTTEKEDYLLRVYNHYRRTYSGTYELISCLYSLN
jgi:hypothetical protein